MEIVDSSIEKYLADTYGKRHAILLDMESEARERNFPIVGPLVGKLLYQLAKMVDATRIFEMGSGYGYSAFWWASALADKPDGEIVLTEKSESNRLKGESYLKRADLLQHVKYFVGDGLEVIDKVPGEFDIVFIDAEKTQYPSALEKGVKRIRRGGLIVADNVLWSGRVVEQKGDPSTEAIKEFNRRLFSMNDFTASIVPVRDGVAVAFKL